MKTMNFISVSLILTLTIPSLGHESLCLPSSCAELIYQGNRISGIYTIYPRKWFKPTPFQVYCDMETDGGGWTVFQRRDDFVFEDGTRENFFRNWTDYKTGFGDLNKEFWLGNEYLYILTNQDRVTLRVDLEDFEIPGNSRVAKYEYFHITNEKNDYTSTITGYSGDASDCLAHHNSRKFVTIGRNDHNSCAEKFKGGWWYGNCHDSNLNGLYLKGKHDSYADGVNWQLWHGYHYSLKKTEMKIRPIMDDQYYNNCHFDGTCPESSCTTKGNTNLEAIAELETSKQITPPAEAKQRLRRSTKTDEYT